MTRRRVGLAAGLLVVAGCGGTTPEGPVVAPAMAEVRLVAEAIVFTPGTVSVPAGVPFRVALDNLDAGVPHNVEVLAGTAKLGESAIIVGPDSTEIEVPGLAPGAYRLLCSVHPTMVTSLVVGG